MRRRQKLLLIIYVYSVIFLSFIYVPYERYFPGGAKKFIGHHLRIKMLEMYSWDNITWGNVAIDADLVIAEVLAITAITVVGFILLKHD